MARLTILSLACLVACISAEKAPVYGKCLNSVMSVGPCLTGKAGPCGQGSGPMPGYACDRKLSHCCPTVNLTDKQYQIGPAIGGLCPMGYVVVYGLNSYADGTCIDINSSS